MATDDRCRCGHSRREHDFDGWGQPFGCLAHTYDGPMGTITCECATWEPRPARRTEPIGHRA